MRRASALLATTAVLAGCMGDAEPAVTVGEGPRLVLQPADLPSPPWTRFDVGRQGIADAPGGSRSDSARFGRQGGWKARYRRPGSSTTTGPLVIESRADVFESADGARADLDAIEDDLGQTLAGAQRLDDPDLGDEAIAATAIDGTVRHYLVAWREGNVSAWILVNGFRRGIRWEEALEISRKQQKRIAAAAMSTS
jgi:hypothetical protein